MINFRACRLKKHFMGRKEIREKGFRPFADMGPEMVLEGAHSLVPPDGRETSEADKSGDFIHDCSTDDRCCKTK